MLWGRTVSALAILAVCTGEQIQTIKHVSLSIFYEALDLNSLKYFKEQLLPAFKKINSKDPHMMVVLVPNGNAHYTGKCTHGPDECSLNRLMACAAYKPKFSYEQNLRQIQFSTCVMETGIAVLKDIQKCAKPAGFDKQVLQQCQNLPGDLEEKMMSHHLNAVGHDKVLLPRILVNDKYDHEAESQLKVDTFQVACKYLDNIPDACAPYRAKGPGFEHQAGKKASPAKIPETRIMKDNNVFSRHRDGTILVKQPNTTSGKQPSKPHPAVPMTSGNMILDFFYEALDPESLNILEKTILPTMKVLNKNHSYVHVNLIPHGNTKSSGTCTNGPDECKLNTLISCANEIFSESYKTIEQLEFSVCVMKRRIAVMKSLEECTKPVGLDVEELKMCTNSSRGQQLQDMMALLTPKNKMVWPRIKIDLVYTPKSEKEFKSDPIGFTCKYLKQKPPACQSLTKDKTPKKVISGKTPHGDKANASKSSTLQEIPKISKTNKIDARIPEPRAKGETAKPPSDVQQTSLPPFNFFSFISYYKI